MDSIPPQALASVIDAVLEQAKLSKALRQAVSRATEDVEHAVGRVATISTDRTRTTVYIASPLDPRDITTFSFPPNPLVFAAELKRAQDHARPVGVVHKTDARAKTVWDSNVIVSVNVHWPKPSAGA